MQVQVQHILQKLEHLSPERQAEVEDFIEFLHQRDHEQQERKDFALASNASFAKVWDNDDDAIYDTL